MMTKFTFKKMILIFIAVLFICFLISDYIYRNLLFWHGARFDSIATLSVDFSKSGTYNLSYDYPGGGVSPFFALDVPKKFLSSKTKAELIRGLQATYTAIDKDGDEAIKGSLVTDKKIVDIKYSNHLIGLCYSHTEYIDYLTINITINQGAPQLKGIPQRLVLMDSSLNQAGFDDFGKLLLIVFILISVISFATFLVIHPNKYDPKYNQEITNTENK